jgi:hypothetical protein
VEQKIDITLIIRRDGAAFLPDKPVKFEGRQKNGVRKMRRSENGSSGGE